MMADDMMVRVAETSAAIMESLLENRTHGYKKIYADYATHNQGFVEIWRGVARAAMCLEKIASMCGGWIRTDGQYVDCVEKYARQVAGGVSLCTCSDKDLLVLARKVFVSECE